MILRYRLLGIEQYVVDPEREYEKLAKKFKWKYYKNRANITNIYKYFRYKKRKYRRRKRFFGNKNK